MSFSIKDKGCVWPIIQSPLKNVKYEGEACESCDELLGSALSASSSFQKSYANVTGHGWGHKYTIKSVSSLFFAFLSVLILLFKVLF